MNNKMMGPEQSHKQIDEAIKTMATLTKGLGIVIMAFGSFCLLTIESVQNFTGFSAVAVTILAWALLVLGIGLVAVPFIEKMKARKLQ
ncbi:MAG: hypothetical protein DYH13_01835 [Alphaproteobacteria bacterium PRO2]|nr:hypothetical protein [Alphaproteobacteria bacterium PRO2]